jgi:hypothetical protein
VIDPSSWWCQINAGRVADIATLMELHGQHHMPYSAEVCRGAARSGSISRLQWLLDEQQCPTPNNLDCFAVYAPTLDMLKWLKQRGCVFTVDICTAAAKFVHAAHVLHYLHTEGAPFDVRTMITALRYQGLPLVKWLYEHGCALSQEVAKKASELINLEKLSWLHSKGCPCDYEDICVTAASYNDIELLQWIKDNGVVDWSAAALSDSLNIAGANGHLDTAKVREHIPR